MKIAVFYHCILHLKDPPIDFDHASHIFREAMRELDKWRLMEACDELYIGVSGGEANVIAACEMAPEKAVILPHALSTCGELPTLRAIQEWLPGHDDWFVLYFHTKGATYKGHIGWDAWRRCMLDVVVVNWQQCVKDLEQGFDCAGPHWLTPQKYPGLMDTPYFAGTFWWARADYLKILPPVDPCGPTRWDAEAWIGRSPRKIKVKCYANHWPGGPCMQ